MDQHQHYLGQDCSQLVTEHAVAPINQPDDTVADTCSMHVLLPIAVSSGVTGAQDSM